MTLRYENIAKVGDRIRSYDFEGRTDCYVEGIVQSIRKNVGGFDAFVITVDKDEWPEGDNHRIGTTVFVPMGLGWGEYNGRIINLTAVEGRQLETIMSDLFEAHPLSEILFMLARRVRDESGIAYGEQRNEDGRKWGYIAGEITRVGNDIEVP